MPIRKKMSETPQSPVVRLAVTNDGMPSKESWYSQAIGKESPTVHLAHVPGAQGDNVLMGRNGVEALPDTSLPALLVSYWYIRGFLENQHRYKYRDWMLDSGAFSAHNSGKEIDLGEYIKFCLRVKAEDKTLREIIALDVIGDGPGSLINAHNMRDAGVDAMPVFHIGEDWAILKEYCEGWSKVGLSCRFGESIKESMCFYGQCFARHWPKKFHSFGWQGEVMLETFPFHSSDSADWEIKPARFGTWRSFAKKGSTAYMNLRGSKQNLRCEVEWYLALEARLRQRWENEMKLLDAQQAPIVRLVAGTGRSAKEEGIQALNGR